MGISGDMVVRVGASLDDFRRELARGPEVAARFAADVARAAERAFAPPRLNAAAYGAEGERAGRAFAQGLQGGTQGADAFGGLQQAATRAAGAIAAAFTVGGAIRAADAWQSSANALRLVTGSSRDAAVMQERLFQVAQQTRTEFGATAGLYAVLARSARELGASQTDILRATTAVTQAFALSGASASETAGTIRQLGQALASGVLRGDEFNSLTEQAPRLAQAIADMAGVSVGALRKMAEAGQLTSKLVFGALLGQADQIGAEFGRLAPTIGGAFTQLSNAAQRFVGVTSAATGAGAALSTTLSVLATNFETVADAALLVGAGIGIRRLAPVVGEVAAALRSVAAAGTAEAAIAGRAAATDLTRAQAARALAVAKGQQATTALQTLRVEQAEIGSALRRAAAAAASAQAAGLQVRATAAYQGLLARQIALDGELVAAETALTAARVRLTGATSAMGAAQARLTAINATSTAGATAASLASQGFAGVIRLLGGAPTAAATAAIAALYGAYRIYANNVSVAREETDSFVRSLDQGTDLQIASQLAKAESDLALARAARAGPIRQDRGGLRAIDEEIQRQQTLVKGLQQVQRQRQLATLAGRGTPQQEIDAEITRLSKLRDAGVATATEYGQITTRVRALRAELAQLGGGPQTDRTQQRRIDIQAQIDALTKVTDASKAGKQAIDRIRDAAQQAIAVAATLGEQVAATATPDTGLIDAHARAVANIGAQYVAVSERIERLGGIERAGLELTRVWGDLAKALAETIDTSLKGIAVPAIRATPTVDIRPLSNLRIPPVVLPFTVSQVLVQQQAENAFAVLQREMAQQGRIEVQVGLAAQAGDPQVAAILRRQLDEATAATKKADAALAALLLKLSPEERANFLKRMGRDASDTASALKQATTAAERFNTRMQAIGDLARGVLGIADAFGKVSDSARHAVDGIVNTLGAIGRARQELERLRTAPGGNPNAGIGSLFGSLTGISSLVGAIGGLVGLVSSFRGGDRAQQESNDIARRTNELIANLNAKLTDTTNSLGSITDTIQRVNQLRVGGPPANLQGILLHAQFDASGRTDTAIINHLLDGVKTFDDALRAVSLVGGSKEATEFFQTQLQRVGLSLDALNRVAQENGLTILDSKGRLAAGAFDTIQKVLDLTRQSLLHWGASLDDVTSRQDFVRRIRDVDNDPSALLTDARDAFRLFTTNAPALFDQLFGGIDTAGAAGRATLNDRLNALVDQLLGSDFQQGRGQLFDQLAKSGFTDLAAFRTAVLAIDSALDGFTTSTDQATAATTQMATALGNVPEVFKKALDFRRFEAMQPVPAPLGGIIPHPIAATPGALPNASVSAASTSVGERTPTVIYQYQLTDGAIVVQAADRPAREVFDDIDRELARRTRAALGSQAPGTAGLVLALNRRA